MAEEGLDTLAERHAGGPLGQWVAIFTAILASVGAFVSYQGSHLMNEVLVKKNEAVLRKAEATNEWNHYQAASTKAHLAEMTQQLVAPERAAQFGDKLDKYREQKDELMTKARALDDLSTRAEQEAEALNAPHTRFAMSMIFLQIAISIASITALTQRRWLFAFAVVSAASGVGLWLSAVLLRG